MKALLILAVLLLTPLCAQAGRCTAPQWEGFDANGASVGTLIQVSALPLATLALPAGFTSISVTPEGSVAFRGYETSEASALLMFETLQTAELHERPTPYALFSAIFQGLDEAGCRYLAEGFELDKEDYRLHFIRSADVEVYAFGTKADHKFYLLDRRRPDLVLVGSFRNMTRTAFESVLSTLNVK